MSSRATRKGRGREGRSRRLLVLVNIRRCECVSCSPTGSITMEDLLAVLPFGGTFDLVQLSGATLRKVFEFSVRRYGSGTGEFLQVSGTPSSCYLLLLLLNNLRASSHPEAGRWLADPQHPEYKLYKVTHHE